LFYDDIHAPVKIRYALIKLRKPIVNIGRDGAYFHNMPAKTQQMSFLIANEFTMANTVSASPSPAHMSWQLRSGSNTNGLAIPPPQGSASGGPPAPRARPVGPPYF
jgi:hypothetical protein